tara:strand:+ start:556 stop:774 length:219 start_codon:yes stop_codon:yes gene_type:complete
MTYKDDPLLLNLALTRELSSKIFHWEGVERKAKKYVKKYKEERLKLEREKVKLILKPRSLKIEKGEIDGKNT